MQAKWTRIVAAAAASVGWAGLALQLALIVGNLGAGLGIWRFVGFFTILANAGAALVATTMALRPRSTLAEPRAQLMAATSILTVGIVYWVALRGLHDLEGFHQLANIMLHDVTPLLWLTLWLLSRDARPKWSDLGWALAPPALYAVYALGRGAIDGWYAYWFLDPSRLSLPELLASMGFILTGVAAVAAMLIAVKPRLIGPRAVTAAAPARSRVDEAGLESFPASDPPGWTLGEERTPE